MQMEHEDVKEYFKYWQESLVEKIKLIFKTLY